MVMVWDLLGSDGWGWIGAGLLGDVLLFFSFHSQNYPGRRRGLFHVDSFIRTTQKTHGIPAICLCDFVFGLTPKILSFVRIRTFLILSVSSTPISINIYLLFGHPKRNRKQYIFFKPQRTRWRSNIENKELLK